MQDLKDRGAKIIIGEFYASSARHIMCAAYKLSMTQREGYAWFLPGWFDNNWYDIDELRRINNETVTHDEENNVERDNHGMAIMAFDDMAVGDLPDCTTRQMVSEECQTSRRPVPASQLTFKHLINEVTCPLREIVF